jgi:hypothetical protein
MTKKAICTFALALGFTAMVATSSLSAQQAPGENSNSISIPFAFHVEKVAMPAGEYRLERIFGKEIVTLVNLRTGQRVQVLRPDATSVPGKSRLTFETGPGGYSLKKIS